MFVFLYVTAYYMKVFPLFSVWFSPNYSPKSAASATSLEDQSFSRIFAAVVERTVNGCQQINHSLSLSPSNSVWAGGWVS